MEEIKKLYEVHYSKDVYSEELKRFKTKGEAMTFARKQAKVSPFVEVILQEIEYRDGEISDFGDFKHITEWIRGKRVDL